MVGRAAGKGGGQLLRRRGQVTRSSERDKRSDKRQETEEMKAIALLVSLLLLTSTVLAGWGEIFLKIRDFTFFTLLENRIAFVKILWYF